jgi:hypothetical protein
MVRSRSLRRLLLWPAIGHGQVFLNINPDWSPDGGAWRSESRDGEADLWLLAAASGSSRD